jgi:hypothetical protein
MSAQIALRQRYIPESKVLAKVVDTDKEVRHAPYDKTNRHTSMHAPGQALKAYTRFSLADFGSREVRQGHQTLQRASEESVALDLHYV